MEKRQKGFSAIVAVIILALVATGVWVVVKKYPGALPASVIPGPSSQSGDSMAASPTGQPSNDISLTVAEPADKSTVSAASVTVRGKTVAGADIFVNDTEGKADADGNYAVSVSLGEGDNPLVVVANDANGNSAEKDITVTYAP